MSYRLDATRAGWANGQSHVLSPSTSPAGSPQAQVAGDPDVASGVGVRRLLIPPLDLGGIRFQEMAAALPSGGNLPPLQSASKTSADSTGAPTEFRHFFGPQAHTVINADAGALRASVPARRIGVTMQASLPIRLPGGLTGLSLPHFDLNELYVTDEDRKRDAGQFESKGALPDEASRQGTVEGGVHSAVHGLVPGVAAGRAAVLARYETDPVAGDAALDDYYWIYRVAQKAPAAVEAELAALSQMLHVDPSAHGAPVAMLRLLEARPDLLTPDLFGHLYARLLNLSDDTPVPPPDRLSRLLALRPGFVDAHTFSVTHAAIRAYKVGKPREAAAAVRHLFERYWIWLSVTTSLRDEFRALRAGRHENKNWIIDAVCLFELFPHRLDHASRSQLERDIDASGRFTAGGKRLLHRHMAEALQEFGKMPDSKSAD